MKLMKIARHLVMGHVGANQGLLAEFDIRSPVFF